MGKGTKRLFTKVKGTGDPPCFLQVDFILASFSQLPDAVNAQ